MKGVLPWMVRWALRAGTRDFCPEVEFIKLKAAKIYRFLQLLSHSRGFFARV